MVPISTGFTPFKLLFGDEVVYLEELKNKSARIISETKNTDYQQVSKDAIKETRLDAIEQINKYKAESRKWRDGKVKLT